ncbi:MAG: rhomboid family intramembrane serine protease [Cohaesibacter sp.]|nr:rhomboid family intramembrane serine protease [Cohaesibacter sp.]
MVQFGKNGGSWNMPDGRHYREPMFNLPQPIMVLGGLMVAIHVVREFFLSDFQAISVLATFAFIPAKAGDIWTFVTYAFLHGSWMHLILNLVWMAAFATVVLRRIGTARFAGFFVVSAVAGAGLHSLFHAGSVTPLVGVSAVLSGAMAASARFAFSGYGSWSDALQASHRQPCLSLQQLRNNKQAMAFLTVWLVLNLIFGVLSLGGGGSSIAWEAHLGGFVAGLFLFPYFDSFSQGPRKPSEPKPKKKDHPHIRVIK